MRAFRIAVIMMICLTARAGAQVIFSNSFEGPVVGGLTSGTDPSGWTDTSPSGSGCGLGYLTGSSYANYVGSQAAWLNCYNTVPQLETTTAILNTNLVAETRYALSFNAASDSGSYFGYYTAYADLMAGETVVLTASVTPNESKDFAPYVATNAFIPKSGDPGVGDALKIRLRTTGGHWSEDCYIDNLRLEAVASADDTTPPTPNPLTWVQTPTACGSNGIVMTCSMASDINFVEYLFTNTVNGKTSGWIDETTWWEKNLSHLGTYSYKVMARDRSVNYNKTDWSTEESTAANQNVLFYDSFEYPVTNATQSGADPRDWQDTSPSGNRAGIGRLFGTGYWNFEGHQAVWMNVYGTVPVLETTSNNLCTILQADKEPYGLSFNAAASSTYTLHADLFAGSNVVLTASTTASSQDFSSHFATNFYLPSADDPGVGELLRIRLRVTGGEWNHQSYIDNVKLTGPKPPGPPGMVIFLK